MADLAAQDFKILTPLSEHLPFDFVAYDPLSKRLFKVQSKYKSLVNGILSVNLQTCYSSSKRVFSSRYDTSTFDVLATYCPDIDKVVYVLEIDLMHLKRSVNFCLQNKKGTRFIEDYVNLRKLLSVVP